MTKKKAENGKKGKKSTSTQFKPGNQLWNLREYPGRPKLFDTPEEFWEAATEYFLWCEDNYLEEEKLFCFQGVVTRDKIKKIRAMTIQGLCLHMGISDDTFANYGKSPDFLAIVEHVRKCIYEQKLTGAAADLLNASIISRELGLTDKIENTVKDTTMRDTSKLSDEELELMDKLERKMEE